MSKIWGKELRNMFQKRMGEQDFCLEVRHLMGEKESESILSG